MCQVVGPTGPEFSDSQVSQEGSQWFEEDSELLPLAPTGVTHIGPPIPLSQKLHGLGNKASYNLEQCFNHQWGLERARHKILLQTLLL